MQHDTKSRPGDGPVLNRRALLCGALALPALALASPAKAQGIRWQRIPGGAMDIGANAGQVCVIGQNEIPPGGFGIYRWNGKTSGNPWVTLPGAATDITVDQAGNPWVVTEQGGIYRWQGGRFVKVPGEARDIGAGGGQIYVLGSNIQPGGFGIWRWDRGKWTSVQGGGYRIAVDNTGAPWLAQEDGRIWMLERGKWEYVPGRANDIAANGNRVFAIGQNATKGGFGIYEWNPGGEGGNPWDVIPGGAVRIAADAQGMPWVVNDVGAIFSGRV